MRTDIRLEVCLDSVEACVAAQQAGADRMELCSALLEGGLTPSAGLLAVARRSVTLPIMAMVRPRGGDFCYTDAELQVMLEDVERLKHAGAAGIVLGLLQPEGTVDEKRTSELVARARPLPVTFHRAFDMTRDPHQALRALMEIGVERVLTSGQEATVLEGVGLLRELVEAAGERIIIMPGGPVSEPEMRLVVERTGASEFHFACFEESPSPMRYRNPKVYMGAAQIPSEYSRSMVSADRVRAMIRAARG